MSKQAITKSGRDTMQSRSKISTYEQSEKQTVTNPGREDEDDETCGDLENQKTQQNKKKGKSSSKKKIVCVSVSVVVLLIGFVAIAFGAVGLALGWNI
uniref:Transmembrane protein n=1 Tax=Ditylenchus dipsaci TaxID=166011 RepID=A0A915DYW6_9BILA